MKLNINVKEGLGAIRFDMPVEEVVSILGEADEVENIDNAIDESTTVLRYNDDTLTLFFEGDCPILTCIDTEDDEITLFGENIFDMSEREIVQLMVNHNFFEQDVEIEDWGERRVSFNEGNIDFFFEDDELLSVVFGK